MVWQDRQNAVVFDRSISLAKPKKPQKIGRINNATNARIFPPRLAVTLGRQTRTPINTALNNTSPLMRLVANDINHSRSHVLIAVHERTRFSEDYAATLSSLLLLMSASARSQSSRSW
jgi:hypothetical protein